MKSKGSHEGCIEQVYRLYADSPYGAAPRLDDDGRLRADDWELDEDVQRRVTQLWPQVTTEDLHELTDFAGYKSDFLRLFGFEVERVDYDADANPEVPIPNLIIG